MNKTFMGYILKAVFAAAIAAALTFTGGCQFAANGSSSGSGGGSGGGSSGSGTTGPAPTTIYFDSSTASVSESGGTLNITINTNKTAEIDASATYTITTAGQTYPATGAGADFTLANGTVTVAANTSSATISATIVNDTTDEYDETFVVTLSSPSGANLGIVTVCTVTITDDDAAPTVTYTTSSQSGAESVGSLTVTAQLSAASAKTITVPFTLTGTATSGGTDYTPSPAASQTINAGVTSAAITFTIVDDAVDEVDETVIVTMGTPTNATQGATTVHTITITDNDTSPPVWGTPCYTDNPATYTYGRGISVNSPSISTVDPIIGYTVVGAALPAGLSLTAGNGKIGGTPTEIVTAQNYTIRANNGATADCTLTITVGPTYTVNYFTFDTSDSNQGNGICSDAGGNCSFRAAVQEANAYAGAEAIYVAAGTTTLASEVSITGTTLIYGVSSASKTWDFAAHTSIVSGNTATRILNITGATTIKEMLFKDGSVASTGACFYISGVALTISDVEFDNCDTSGVGSNGGALYFTGASSLSATELSIQNSSVENTTTNGGAIYFGGSGTLTLTDSFLSNNSARNGGGLYLVSGATSATITGSSFQTNTCNASTGGAIFTSNALSVTNSTFNANVCRFGPSIYATGNITVTNSTIVNSTGNSTAGMTFNGGTHTLTNNVFYNNLQGGVVPDNCLVAGGAVVTSGNNVIDTTFAGDCTFMGAGTNDQESVDPSLGAYQDNGGLTLTLMPGDPLLDVGTNTGCPTTDQRGQARPYNGTCDVGAVEAQFGE